MRFPWSQVVKAVIGMAVLIVVLERAAGFSLVLERGASSFKDAFGALTPSPQGQTIAARALRPPGRA